jgi:hypothetical protein
MDNPRTTSNMALMTMDDLQKASKVFMASGLFPDVDSEAKAIVKIMAGAELGFSPIASMRGVNVFMGRVSLSADLMAALVKKNERYNFRVVISTANKCTIEWYDKGTICHQSEFTIEQAQQAGLFGKPQKLWEKYPRDMLYARALSRGAKVVCPQRLAGLDLSEESSAPDEAAEAIPPTMTNAPFNGHAHPDIATGEYRVIPTTNGNGHTAAADAKPDLSTPPMRPAGVPFANPTTGEIAQPVAATNGDMLFAEAVKDQRFVKGFYTWARGLGLNEDAIKAEFHVQHLAEIPGTKIEVKAKLEALAASLKPTTPEQDWEHIAEQAQAERAQVVQHDQPTSAAHRLLLPEDPAKHIAAKE